jgi:hypothetical protein
MLPERSYRHYLAACATLLRWGRWAFYRLMQRLSATDAGDDSVGSDPNSCSTKASPSMLSILNDSQAKSRQFVEVENEHECPTAIQPND